jgi:outer membrane immunogenic protein
VKKTAAAASVSALALSALAAPAYAVEPAGDHDWTGFYVGGTLGLTAADLDWEIDWTLDGGEGGLSSGQDSVHPSQSTAGVSVQAGYDHQLGPIVVGAQVDYTATHFEEDARSDGGDGADLRTEIHGLGTARARVGYPIGDCLLFAAGGLAFGDLKHTFDSDGSTDTTHAKDKLGWTAGGGVEVAIAENVSLIAEGLYISFEKSATAPGPLFDEPFEVETALMIGRVGVNYRF